jgi:outer membrane protein OmpA-like peptidoglycan-associated protein
MKCRLALFAALFVTMLFALSPALFAQGSAEESPADIAFWVNHWSQPRVALFGPEHAAFNQNMLEILFPYDGHNDPSNPEALDTNVQWLKDHPSVRFYINGYASSRGPLIYNLALSQRRADWVKKALVDRGIPESRIAISVGWGELYPVCPEVNDECWSKNRRVRFSYSPN